jgi:hypothetical protein
MNYSWNYWYLIQIQQNVKREEIAYKKGNNTEEKPVGMLRIVDKN